MDGWHGAISVTAMVMMLGLSLSLWLSTPVSSLRSPGSLPNPTPPTPTPPTVSTHLEAFQGGQRAQSTLVVVEAERGDEVCGVCSPVFDPGDEVCRCRNCRVDWR